MNVSFEELFSVMKEKLVKHGCSEEIAERSARNLASSTRDGVMYPMQTFSKAKSMDLRRVPCYTEGSDEATLHEINALAASIFGNVREMTSQDRRYLHLAAVFACNFTNYCYDIASAIVAHRGVGSQAERVFPLRGTDRPCREIRQGCNATPTGLALGQTQVARHIQAYVCRNTRQT